MTPSWKKYNLGESMSLRKVTNSSHLRFNDDFRDFIWPRTAETLRGRAILRFVVPFIICLKRKAIQRMYAPGGPGCLSAKRRFEEAARA